MSDKNRIKRLRKIVVGGKTYKYLVSKKDNKDGYKYTYLQIWKDKKPIYSEIVQGEESVQPRIVEGIIKNGKLITS